jgi:hypothetical protein
MKNRWLKVLIGLPLLSLAAGCSVTATATNAAIDNCLNQFVSDLNNNRATAYQDLDGDSYTAGTSTTPETGCGAYLPATNNASYWDGAFPYDPTAPYSISSINDLNAGAVTATMSGSAGFSASAVSMVFVMVVEKKSGSYKIQKISKFNSTTNQYGIILQ